MLCSANAGLLGMYSCIDAESLDQVEAEYQVCKVEVYSEMGYHCRSVMNSVVFLMFLTIGSGQRGFGSLVHVEGVHLEGICH